MKKRGNQAPYFKNCDLANVKQKCQPLSQLIYVGITEYVTNHFFKNEKSNFIIWRQGDPCELVGRYHGRSVVDVPRHRDVPILAVVGSRSFVHNWILKGERINLLKINRLEDGN